jgi:hypothetical protein
MSLQELKTWAESHSTVPIDQDEVFCTEFEFQALPVRKFRIFLSTVRLLENTINQKNVVCDATYKLIFEEYPVFTIGSIDKDKHFHPFGLGIASNEEQSDFNFMFSSVKNAAKKIHSFSYSPEILIADE